MRHVPLASALLLLAACSSTEASSSGDAGTTGDVGTWTAASFGALEWYWYGTGASDSFAMDRDCGITSSTSRYGKPREDRAGVVPETECSALAGLAVSRPVLEALRDPAPSCTADTDDYANTAVTLTNGTKFRRNTSGCSGTEPFQKLQAEMRRLGQTYGLVVEADAALDAPDDAAPTD